MKSIYLDYAAATPTDDRVIKRVAELSGTLVGNPSSSHSFGEAAAKILTDSRTAVAHFLNCQPAEVYLTASGTESNNLAVLGIARANKGKGQHIITTAIEHPSVLNACRALEREGFGVTYLPVGKNGRVSVAQLEEAFRSDTTLVTIHLANSEIGVIQDVTELAKAARKRGIIFHTDACQAGATIALDTAALGVDALSLNGSKIYGPRGIGALFVRDNVSIFPIVYGGGQEKSLRSGTENVPGIAGLALACEIALSDRAIDSERIQKLRDQLQADLEAIGCEVNVASSLRLPNHLSVIVPTHRTNLVESLDELGVAVSSGSACSSRTQTDSHVLAAIGLTSEQIHHTIRVSLGRATTTLDCQALVEAIKAIV